MLFSKKGRGMMEAARDFYEGLLYKDASKVKALVSAKLKEGHSADEILNDGLIEGMYIVGRGFKEGDIYLPEVMMAAKNMQAGVDILKPLLTEQGAKPIGRIALGTVQGDIHDIGKNIVGMIMAGSGFEVINLGVDIQTEKFIEHIEQYEPDILGLSALLTSTMTEMKKVIEAVHKSHVTKKPKIIVGGAPVTQEFADEIGADAYGKDAVSGAEKAKELLGIT
jgi:5-methyltetrahydrofolate--homocysteine methyltransferase